MAIHLGANWTTQEFSDLIALAKFLETGFVGAQTDFPPQSNRAPERDAGIN